jgi:hypothetical protein
MTIAIADGTSEVVTGKAQAVLWFEKPNLLRQAVWHSGLPYEVRALSRSSLAALDQAVALRTNQRRMLGDSASEVLAGSESASSSFLGGSPGHETQAQGH